MKNKEYNHTLSIFDAHLVLRRMIMTREIKSEIKEQLIVQIASNKVISLVRLSESFDFANVNIANVALDSSFINSMIKTRDIYNILTQMRRNALEFITSMQALMHQLDDDD